MSGFTTDHTGNTANPNRAAVYHLGIDPADRCKTQIALRRDAGDHKADLIHVRGEEERMLRPFAAFYMGQHVAHRIHANRHVRRALLQDAENILPNGVLSA